MLERPPRVGDRPPPSRRIARSVRRGEFRARSTTAGSFAATGAKGRWALANRYQKHRLAPRRNDQWWNGVGSTTSTDLWRLVMTNVSAFAAILLLASAPVVVAQTTTTSPSPPVASSSTTAGSG